MAELWNLVPLSGITEVLDWKTDIQQAFSREMRHSTRGARRAFSYRFGVVGDYLKAEEMARANPSGDWDVPVWTESSKAGPVLSTDTVLMVDVNASYTDRALVFGSCDDWIIVTIDSIGAGLNLAAPVGQGFENPSVMPVKVGFSPAGLAVSRRGYDVFESEITFILRGEEDHAATARPQYLGLDYYDCAGAFVEPVSATIQQPLEIIDNGMGPLVAVPVRSLISAGYLVAAVLETTAKRWEMFRWAHHLRGKDRPFWVPVWGGDLQLAAAAVIGAANILVAPVLADVAQYVGRHLHLGGAQFRVITAAVIVAGNHRLSLAALTEPAMRPALLRKVRMDTDRLEFRHARGFAAHVGFPVVEVAA